MRSLSIRKIRDQFNTPVFNFVKLLLVFVLAVVISYLGFRIGVLLIPFVLALLCSMAIEPLVKLLCKIRIGEKSLPRTPAVIISMLVSGGIMGGILTVLVALIVQQLISFAQDIQIWLPDFIRQINALAIQLDDKIHLLPYDIPDELLNRVVSSLYALVGQLTTAINSVAKGVWNAASLLPDVFLFVIMWLVGTFYIASWRHRMVRFMRRELPSGWLDRMIHVKDRLFSTLFGYVRAQLMMMGMVFLIILVGLSILDVQYALILSIVIALFDALPLIGSGLFLNTWAIFALFTGNMGLALGLFLTWVAVAIGRNMLEPRLVGGQIGLPPLLTMIAMYAGFRLMGFLGMIVGPVMAVILTIVYEYYAQGRTLRQVLDGAKPSEPVKDEEAQAGEPPQEKR